MMPTASTTAETTGVYRYNPVAQPSSNIGIITRVTWHKIRTCTFVLVGSGLTVAAIAAGAADAVKPAAVFATGGLLCLTTALYRSLNPLPLTQRNIAPLCQTPTAGSPARVASLLPGSQCLAASDARQTVTTQPIQTVITGNSTELPAIAETLKGILHALGSVTQIFPDSSRSAEVSKRFRDLRKRSRDVPFEQNLNGGACARTSAANFRDYAIPKCSNISCHQAYCAMPGQAYHANYIDMHYGNFIAAQGAVNRTHNRFLQLLAVNDTAVSVALVTESELNRPDNTRIGPTDTLQPKTIPALQITTTTGTETLPSVSVSLVGSIDVPDMKLRIDQLEINGKPHFRMNEMGWVDGTANNPIRLAAITMIAETLRKHPAVLERANHPMVVNCNAGVGRTGTFIVASDIIRHYGQNPQGDTLDIDSKILAAKQRRSVQFVQNSGQYQNLVTLQENRNTLLQALFEAVK
ncbi:protein-tyrosine phosphatase family protein [Endozoicomonas sp. YOMI1]|uniref:protein-tyrosine phosphatase family protein n=1 Tax=Endozoicomonas sp. YOMI1 TaxID=2828739 RepID=UPI00214844E3|nr:protein-tyrosine phosphatase family protein [Endozoicomonas sp. YOMI1]